MPVQILYPTGIRQNWGAHWVNQSGHFWTANNIGVKDIDEGIPDDKLDWINDNVPQFEDFYRIDLLTGPLLVEPEYVTFKMSYLYSGYLADDPQPDYLDFEFILRDNNLDTIALVRPDIVTSGVGDWNTIEASATTVNLPPFDLTDTNFLMTFRGAIDVGDVQAGVNTSGHFISAIEIQVSGDNIHNSGVPFYTESYYHKRDCIKPTTFYGLSNRWTSGYDYSGIFDIGYLRIQEGSGNKVYADNTSLSGTYIVTGQGLESGLLWHNKRLTLNQHPTYELAPKFNSVDDSAIVFDSGILYNKDFSIMGRFFPSGESFEINPSGYFSLFNDSHQDGTGDYLFKVESSGYTTFRYTMFDSVQTQYTTNVNIDGRYGFDILAGYGSGSGYLYVQSHHAGEIGSGTFLSTDRRQDHRTRLSIGGILASGV